MRGRVARRDGAAGLLARADRARPDRWRDLARVPQRHHAARPNPWPRSARGLRPPGRQRLRAHDPNRPAADRARPRAAREANQLRGRERGSRWVDARRRWTGRRRRRLQRRSGVRMLLRRPPLQPRRTARRGARATDRHDHRGGRRRRRQGRHRRAATATLRQLVPGRPRRPVTGPMHRRDRRRRAGLSTVPGSARHAPVSRAPSRPRASCTRRCRGGDGTGCGRKPPQGNQRGWARRTAATAARTRSSAGARAAITVASSCHGSGMPPLSPASPSRTASRQNGL